MSEKNNKGRKVVIRITKDNFYVKGEITIMESINIGSMLFINGFKNLLAKDSKGVKDLLKSELVTITSAIFNKDIEEKEETYVN